MAEVSASLTTSFLLDLGRSLRAAFFLRQGLGPRHGSIQTRFQFQSQSFAILVTGWYDRVAKDQRASAERVGNAKAVPSLQSLSRRRDDRVGQDRRMRALRHDNWAILRNFSWTSWAVWRNANTAAIFQNSERFSERLHAALVALFLFVGGGSPDRLQAKVLDRFGNWLTIL